MSNHLTPTPSPATPRGSSFLDPQLFGGPMRLSDIVGGYWAITDQMHDEVLAIYDAHMRGEKIDIKGVEARIGRPLANERPSYVVQDGVAILTMSGVIGPKANLLLEISGGTSAQALRNEIMAALDDPKVKSAILYADSPGGNVLGIAEGAAAWRQFAESKPAITYSDGTLASAAYWWGSAASGVYISGPMVNVGSIGVRSEHVDTSMRDAATGVKRTIIKAGAYKAAGDGPLDPKTLEYRQAQVDYLYSLFADTVAMHRGVSIDKVLADMADGRVFIGQQAIDAGLVDGFANLETLVAQMADNPAAIAPLRKQGKTAPRSSNSSKRTAIYLPSATTAAGAAAAATLPAQDEPVPPVDPATTTSQEPPMANDLTRESFERDHAALFGQIRSEALAEGAAQERARIQSVRAQALPGHEALIEQLAMDGKTTGEQAAMAMVVEQRKALGAHASAHANDAPPAAPSGAAGTAADTQPPAAADRKPGRSINIAAAFGALNKRPAATA
jgi:capsid assembly protease